MPHGERRKYEVWKCKGPSLGTNIRHCFICLFNLFIFIFYFYIVVDNVIYNFIMIGGHNKNAVCRGQRWFFKKKIYSFDNPIVSIEREIWILNVPVKNT